MDKPNNGALKLKERSILKTSKRKSNGLNDSKVISRSSRLVLKDASKNSDRSGVTKTTVNSRQHSFADSYLKFDSSSTRYLWKQKTRHRKNEAVNEPKLHAANGTVPSAKLGHNISSENSLHAVHNQDEGTDEQQSADEKSPSESRVEDDDSRTNSDCNELKDWLFDSKSNRMLQSINPSVETLTKRHSFIDSVSQIKNLPRKKTPNGALPQGAGKKSTAKKRSPNNQYDVTIPKVDVRKPYRPQAMAQDTNTDDEGSISPSGKSAYGSVRRTSRTIFTGKMEVLDERVGSSSKSISSQEKDNSNGDSSSPDHVTTAQPTHQEQPQSNLHAAVLGESIKHNSPIQEQEETVNDETEESETVQKPAETSKFLTAICRNHKRRKPGENIDAVLFCRICLQAVCYKCAFERHKDHDVLPLASAVNLIRSKMAEKKREIENGISQMRGRRKIMESSSDDVRKRIKSQLERTVERLQEKGDEIMTAVDKTRQERIGSLYRLQAQNETSWGQIDAVLKTSDDVKMLEEFSSLGPETVHSTDLVFTDKVRPTNREEGFEVELSKEMRGNLGGFGSPIEQVACMSPSTMSLRVSVDLHKLQQEIENLRLQSEEDCNSSVLSAGDINDPLRKKKKLSFKLDPSTAGTALRISPNGTAVEYVGSARNSIHGGHLRIHPQSHTTSFPHSHPYPGMSSVRLRRNTFATVLSDTCITQGKQYWEVSVNRSMEYRLGVAYKHMQGTKTLADDHNSWTLCLTYPDRFSALNKGKKEYIFVASHVANSTSKVMRIGLYLDYERGILSFYNASSSAEKRHLYTFRAFFNRPVWPILSLRQGKLQIVTGLPIPRNLVWKTR